MDVSGGMQYEVTVAGGSGGILRHADAIVGREYDVTFTLVARTSGAVSGRAGGAGGPAVSVPGTYTQRITALNTTGNGVSANSAFVGLVEDISVVLVPL